MISNSIRHSFLYLYETVMNFPIAQLGPPNRETNRTPTTMSRVSTSQVFAAKTTDIITACGRGFLADSLKST